MSTASTAPPSAQQPSQQAGSAGKADEGALDHKLVMMIKHDHEKVRKVFSVMQQQTDLAEKQKYGNELVRLIAVHSHLEELYLYPAIEKHYPNGKEEVDRDRSEHLTVKQYLSKFDGLKSESKEYEPAAQNVMLVFNRHAQHEEQELLPNLKRHFSGEMMDKLHDSMESMRGSVPTHPHLGAPDTGGAAQMAAGMAAAPIDKMRDAARDFPKEV